ncbi:MAG: hypothetical protein MJ000_11120 [Bacteroidales bacterium]|nr:hypothetical protein [Bacteroidales bacterium]
MIDFYRENASEIWIGYNSRHYDQWILKSILAGFNPKEMNDWIILEDRPGWKFSNVLRDFPLNNYDVMSNIDRGLKTFEGFMGSDIRESSVPFDIDRKLTDAEIEETVKYCRHDVEQTIEVFLERYSDFEAQVGLIEMFHMPLSNISKTKVQLAAEILEAKKRKYNDEFDISFPETMQIQKYNAVVDWYRDPKNRCYKRTDSRGRTKKTQLEIIVAGVPHQFGWGGVHGAREKYTGTGYFINMDVASLYPSLMIQYNLHSRSCNPSKFNDIVDTRLKYKAAKNPLQAPLKIVINGTYGAMKDSNNPLYDPRQANNVCVYGQLLLLDLMEHLEPYCEIIQSNTDGVLVKMPDGGDPDEFYHLVDDIAFEWEQRTGLNLEFDEYVKVFQKDVNNYIIVDAEGKYKSKGAYVKKLSRLDYDLPIVNKALVDFMVYGVPVDKTILGCNNIRDFQQVKKISNKYTCIRHGGVRLNEKCVRVFASKIQSDGGLTKIHGTTGRPAKIENTPEHAFLLNDSVDGASVPPYLDKQWYIDMAYKRLNDFGVI